MNIKRIQIFMLSLFLGFFSMSSAQAANEDLDIRILNAANVFQDFNTNNAQAIHPDAIARSNAIIIIPNFIKAGFLYAARFGQGIAIARDPQSGNWGTPAFVRISGGSFGLQLGAQWTELILVGRESFDLVNFKGGPTVGGSASASFGPWGVHSEIGTGWEMNNQVYWYSRNSGVFAALATEGTVFSYDDEANRAYYGNAATRDILFGGIKPSSNGKKLIEVITSYEARSQYARAKSNPAANVLQDMKKLFAQGKEKISSAYSK